MNQLFLTMKINVAIPQQVERYAAMIKENLELRCLY